MKLREKICAPKKSILVFLAFFLVVFICTIFAYFTSSTTDRNTYQSKASEVASQTNTVPALIISGDPIKEKWPFMVLIYDPIEFERKKSLQAPENNLLDIGYCGGVLLDKQWVLTAAHCIRNPYSVGVAIGVNDLNISLNKTENRYDFIIVDNVIVHEDRKKINPLNKDDDAPITNDIALLRMSRSPDVAFSTMSYLENDIFTEEKDPILVMGWGSTQAGPLSVLFSSETLLTGVLPVISNEHAKKILLGQSIPNTIFAAGYINGGVSTYRGDSGGPGLVWDGKKWNLAGVISWGFEKENSNSILSFFTKVSRYKDWIKEKTEITRQVPYLVGKKPRYRTELVYSINPGQGSFMGAKPEWPEYYYEGIKDFNLLDITPTIRYTQGR